MANYPKDTKKSEQVINIRDIAEVLETERDPEITFEIQQFSGSIHVVVKDEYLQQKILKRSTKENKL